LFPHKPNLLLDVESGFQRIVTAKDVFSGASTFSISLLHEPNSSNLLINKHLRLDSLGFPTRQLHRAT
jgi:hypothetical protein